MSADYPAAQEHFVPRSFMFNSNAQKVVVIHKTGGDATPQAVYNTFINSGNPGKSVHYAIGQDGSIWQFVPESLGAGGNGVTDGTMQPFWEPYVRQYGNLNTCTFSIEHCDPSPRNDTPLTAAQKAASFALVAHLCQKYGIAADHIKPHNSICATACPGTYPMAELQSFIQQGGSTTMGVPQGWRDDGTTLTAPNGHFLQHGFRNAVLDAPAWDPGDQPNEEEYGTPQVLLHNASVGGGTRVTTRDHLLWWTQGAGVIQEPYPGLELKAAYDLIAAQQAEIATLKAQQTAPVDTSTVEADINAIADAIAAPVAKALADLKKL